MLAFGVSAMQGSGGGGHKCCLLLVSSRQVVLVGMNASCCSFRAGSGGGGRECRLLLVLSREVVVEIPSPSVSHFEGGRDVAEEWRWWLLMAFVVRFEEGGSGCKGTFQSPSYFRLLTLPILLLSSAVFRYHPQLPASRKFS